MNEIHNMVSSSILEGLGGNNQVSFYESAMGFYHAVNWNQRWLQLLLVGHVFLLLTTLMFRKIFKLQLGCFVFICTCGFLAQPLNRYCKERWTDFADQDYFDESGLFISIVFSGPLLFIGLIQVVSLLLHASTLMIEAKRSEIYYRASVRKKKI